MAKDYNANITMAKNAFEQGLELCQKIDAEYPQFSKSIGIPLADQLRNEMLSYLLYLAETNDGISPVRARFLNDLFGRNLTASDYTQLMKRLNLHEQNYAGLIPVTLKAAQKMDAANGNAQAEKMLIRIYDRLGEAFRLDPSFMNSLEELDQRIYILALTNWMQNNSAYTGSGVMNQPAEEKTSQPVFSPQLTLKTEEEKPAQPEKTLDELMEELNSLIGLDNVKEDVNDLINLLKIKKMRRERNMKDIDVSMHLVFMGNPGTGKTTVARLLAQIYHALGALSKGQLVEVDRSELVGGYVGQTAIKTQEVCDSALGGVLFIDEAYSLTSGKDKADFGYEAVNTLLVEMENNRSDLAVIVAGYPDLMEDFLASNPGLKSRFNKFMDFKDYTGKELYEIFQLQLKSNGYKLDEEAAKATQTIFDDMYASRDENFANGRSVRNFFEKVMVAQANRLAKLDEIDDEQLSTLTREDLETVLSKEKKTPKAPVQDPAAQAAAAWDESQRQIEAIKARMNKNSPEDSQN